MTLWDDLKQLEGWRLATVDADPELGWIKLTFEKSSKKAQYWFIPGAARKVQIEE